MSEFGQSCTDCSGFERCALCDLPIDQDTVLGPYCYRCLTIKLVALEGR